MFCAEIVRTNKVYHAPVLKEIILKRVTCQYYTTSGEREREREREREERGRERGREGEREREEREREEREREREREREGEGGKERERERGRERERREIWRNSDECTRYKQASTLYCLSFHKLYVL